MNKGGFLGYYITVLQQRSNGNRGAATFGFGGPPLGSVLLGQCGRSSSLTVIVYTGREDIQCLA